MTSIEEKVGYSFKNKTLLETAIKHKSFSFEKNDNNVLHNNERLEFLGDAILDAIVSDYLYKIKPYMKEGEMSKKRSEIVKILENTDALVIVDEAYMDFSTESVLDLVEEFDNLIVLKTSSKALGCAAIRLGFAVSSREIVKVLNALRPPYNLNSVTQAIGCAIFSEPEFIKESVSRIIESRNYLYQGIKSLVNSKIEKIYESETNYIYIKTKFAKHIYEELCKRSILIRKFDNSLRITAGTISENDEVIKSVKEILDSLN